MSTQALGKYIITSEILVVTGLHIGGSTVGLEIGGIENPVIKDALTDAPVIPGSSLKGKLRSLMEWRLGLIEQHPKHGGFQAYSCDELKSEEPDTEAEKLKWHNALALARIFGPASDDRKVHAVAGPSRLLVRDAFLTTDSKKNLQRNLGEGSFTEVKTENALDRVTSEANPRPLERVPAGSVFALSMVMDKYERNDQQLIQHLLAAMALLESSYLGGGGSRGSGQVKFTNVQIAWRSVQDYEKGATGATVNLPGNTVNDILSGFDSITWPQ
jgi:CRISPR-associated protein Csm3